MANKLARRGAEFFQRFAALFYFFFLPSGAFCPAKFLKRFRPAENISVIFFPFCCASEERQRGRESLLFSFSSPFLPAFSVLFLARSLLPQQ